MSIRSVEIASMGVALAALFPGALCAQSTGGDVVGPMLERAREAYTEDEPAPEQPADCEVSGDETMIIVCAPIDDDPDRYRVTSRLDKADDSHLSWGGQAPDVSGPGIFKGKATISGLCIVPPCPPPPVYMIDVTALPEAPPGSDADRIGRGLAPRGSRYDDGGDGTEIEGESPPTDNDEPEG